MTYDKKDFGNDFILGISSSAIQTEGATTVDGKRLSIWGDFVKKKNKIYGNDTHEVACDFYDNYCRDIELIKELGIPNFRFSLSWSRILPDSTGIINQKGLEFYHNVIDYCLELGIEPWVTLYH